MIVTKTPLICDQSGYGRLWVTGKDRERFLQGMLSNDIKHIVPGGFVRAALLSVKGRVQAVVDIVRRDDGFVLLTEPAAAAKTHQILSRHAIVDDVVFTELDEPVHRVWSSTQDVWDAAPVFADRPSSPADELEALRILAGMPRYGADVSEDYFPFEANLDSAVSHDKGCYIGQEVVARAHARGIVKKRLHGVRLLGAGATATGTPVTSPAGETVGTLTSISETSLLGPVGLAYLQRAVWEPGTAVRVGDRDAVVSALPFQS